MTQQHQSIGIFDSGFGGLTVMRAIRTLLPFENIIYLGDTARVSYGNKSPETIIRYSHENASFLQKQGIKILVVACHTAASVALTLLKEQTDLPIIGITEQGVEAICTISKTGKIGILGTRATIASEMYQQALRQQMPHADITSVACPLFVPLIEEGYIEHPLTHLAIQDYLRPLKAKSIDTVLLACTHYPLICPLIQQELGADITLIDPAIFCAQQIKTYLEQHNLLNTRQTHPHYQFYVSEDPHKFRLHGPHFLNHPIEHVDLTSENLC